MDEVQETTKGAFLKEKLQNLARWVIAEVGKENLPVDLIAGVDGRSELEAAYMASTLESNSVLVAHRDWRGLAQLFSNRTGKQEELQQVVTVIRQRPEMHDKFWRYMELFVEVARQ
jgi:hypothetical protein